MTTYLIWRSMTVLQTLRATATFASIVTAGLLLCGLSPAVATDFPTRPVTIVVPSPAGGVLDVLARLLQRQLAPVWKQPILVENKPGANFLIGAAFVAKSAADGYTLLVAPEVTFTITSTHYSDGIADPAKDLMPVSGLVNAHAALVAHAAFPARNVAELVALAKSKPGEINYATIGPGSTQHLQMAQFERATGTRFNPVPYKGAAPALNDVIGGQVPMMFIAVREALPHHQKGSARILAVGSAARLPELPDVPTFEEQGLKGFRASTWFGLFVAAGTPKEIVDKINADVRKVFDAPEVKATFVAPGMFEVIAGDPDVFAKRIASEKEVWSRLLRDLDIKAR